MPGEMLHFSNTWPKVAGATSAPPLSFNNSLLIVSRLIGVVEGVVVEVGVMVGWAGVERGAAADDDAAAAAARLVVVDVVEVVVVVGMGMGRLGRR